MRNGIHVRETFACKRGVTCGTSTKALSKLLSDQNKSVENYEKLSDKLPKGKV